MKNTLLFDFNVDRSNHTVYVNREFAAGLSSVWDAFTKQEILDQWWAPYPWVSRTKTMNFVEGGKRHYAMVGPEGQEHWSIETFTSIKPMTDLKMTSIFADKDENINTQLPGTEWELHFSEQNGTTTVRMIIKHKSLADLETHIQMGFKEGFTMTLDHLDRMLSKRS
jgi:uncharacterized protein YndB with AHSA1/START domain